MKSKLRYTQRLGQGKAKPPITPARHVQHAHAARSNLSAALPAPPPGLHPRNLHRDGYAMEKLVAGLPALAAFIRQNPQGQATIDFANPQAVICLNRALLQVDYQLSNWSLPAGYLCPPVPGRADYVHYLADLLKEFGQTGPVRMLDIGTGANLIYPLLAHQSYGWHSVGVDIDQPALLHATQLIKQNQLAHQISLRQQLRSDAIFHGVIALGEQFTVSVCNPPFHASAAHAQAGTQRKWQGLTAARQRLDRRPAASLKRASANGGLNFGGMAHELVCAGGEAQFLLTMMRESRAYATQCIWFTSLVSKASLLPLVTRTLQQLGAKTVRVVAMAQGQKQSRFVAWTFQPLPLANHQSAISNHQVE